MLKQEKRNLDDQDVCCICKKKFTDTDDIIIIFDKAFGGDIKIHKHHNFYDKTRNKSIN